MNKKLTVKDVISSKIKLDDILELIEKWSKENNVCFFGSFISFDDKKIEEKADDVIDEDRICCYGDKESLSIMLGAFVEEFGKNNEDFINF